MIIGTTIKRILVAAAFVMFVTQMFVLISPVRAEDEPVSDRDLLEAPPSDNDRRTVEDFSGDPNEDDYQKFEGRVLPLDREFSADRSISTTAGKEFDNGADVLKTLSRIELRMRDAALRMDGHDLGGNTQKIQRDIENELASLLGQLRKSGGHWITNTANSNTGKTDDPQHNNDKSTKENSAKTKGANDQPGPESPEIPKNYDPIRAKLLTGPWGKLPKSVQEQMLRETNERFLPKYRDELRAYFDRLSRDHP